MEGLPQETSIKALALAWRTYLDSRSPDGGSRRDTMYRRVVEVRIDPLVPDDSHMRIYNLAIRKASQC